MPYTTSKKRNIQQNSIEYTLPNTRSNLFNKGYLKKVLNPPQSLEPIECFKYPPWDRVPP